MDSVKQKIAESEMLDHFSKIHKGTITNLTKDFKQITSKYKLSRCVCRKPDGVFDWHSLYKHYMYEGKDSKYKVMCTYCSMSSGEFKTDKEAVDDWNTKILLLS